MHWIADINISLSVADGGWELITCSRAVKIINECVFNPQKEDWGGGGEEEGAEGGREKEGGRAWWFGRGDGRWERCWFQPCSVRIASIWVWTTSSVSEQSYSEEPKQEGGCKSVCKGEDWSFPSPVSFRPLAAFSSTSPLLVSLGFVLFFFSCFI